MYLQSIHGSHVVYETDVPDAEHCPQVVRDGGLQVNEAVLMGQAQHVQDQLIFLVGQCHLTGVDVSQ